MKQSDRMDVERINDNTIRFTMDTEYKDVPVDKIPALIIMLEGWINDYKTHEKDKNQNGNIS